MKKVYNILFLLALLLCGACEEDDYNYDNEGWASYLLNIYEVVEESITSESAEIKSTKETSGNDRIDYYAGNGYYYNSSIYSSSNSERIKLYVKESETEPEDLNSFFKGARSVDYVIISDFNIGYSPYSSSNYSNSYTQYINGVDNYIRFRIKDLKPNTTYYCVPYVNDGIADVYGNLLSFKTKEASNNPDPSSRSAIDLGLSVKWANMNLGANNVTEKGDTYQLTNVRKNVYQTKYDEVIKAWDQPWRMPSKEEAEELLDKCTWTFTTKDGIEGYQVKGPNGNTIFFPCTNNTSIDLWTGTYYDYWSSNYYKFYFYSVYLDDNDRIVNMVRKYVSYDDYYENYFIRAVQGK